VELHGADGVMTFFPEVFTDHEIELAKSVSQVKPPSNRDLTANFDAYYGGPVAAVVLRFLID
jgi:hypothetical protein